MLASFCKRLVIAHAPTPARAPPQYLVWRAPRPALRPPFPTWVWRAKARRRALSLSLSLGELGAGRGNGTRQAPGGSWLAGGDGAVPASRAPPKACLPCTK